MSVRIPQDSDRCGLVRIEGDPQGVQRARRELVDMAQRMVRVLNLTLSYIQHVLPLDTSPEGFSKSDTLKGQCVIYF